MKAAEKEIELMAKKVREGADLAEEENNETSPNATGTMQQDIKLLRFREVKEFERRKAEDALESERIQLESKVEEIESQMEEIQNRLKFLSKCSKDLEGTKKTMSQTEFPEDLLPELANVVAKSGYAGVMSITNDFVSEYGQPVSKKVICAKIEDIAKKERRKEDGDLRAVWHVLPEYMNLLNVETIRHLRKEKESRLEKKRGGSSNKKKPAQEEIDTNNNGATGPDGKFVEFPDYDGSEEPRECKKAFTLFCTATRKEVKRSLPPENRKDRVSFIIIIIIIFVHQCFEDNAYLIQSPLCYPISFYPLIYRTW